MKKIFTICSILIFILLLFPVQNIYPQYTAGPTMNNARMSHFQVTLDNGKILLLGGHGTGFVSLSTAELFDLSQNSFTIANMNYTHDIGAVVKLNDGKLLIAGGAANLGVAPGYNTAEIYDPSANSFTATNTMTYQRTNCYGTTLSSGKVLISGGWYDATSATYGEIYDPATSTFTAAGALNTPRSNPMVFPTNDGGAVVFGGYYYYGGEYFQSVEYYDPSSNSFSVLEDSIFSGEGGYYIENKHFVTDEFKMTNNKYIFSSFRRTLTDTQTVYFTFDPATKTFESIYRETYSVNDPASQLGFVLDKNSNILYSVWYKSTTPIKIGVSYLDLTSKQMVMPSAWYDLPDSYYPAYSCLALLSDNRILMSGGYSSPDYNTNFTPIANTIFITLPATDILKDQSIIPDKFELFQNYPNPFNPSTLITYQLAKSSNVKLEIFNLLGQNIKTIVNENQSAGIYKFNFDGAGLASGTYFYRLQTNDFVKIRKMILLK